MFNKQISLWGDYYKRDDEIVILAVMQLNRKPDYWKDRQSLFKDDNKFEEANEKP